MSAESKKDFFISYNEADKVNAEWIAWILEEAGYTIVMQLWDFGTGENFALKMQQAMTDSERTIAVLSPNYLSASYTHPEWAGAFAKDPTGEKSLLIPVRVRECELEGLLAQINYIDLVDLDEGKAKEKLLDEIEKKRRKPAEKPSFQRVTVRVVPQKPEFPGGLPAINNVPRQRNSNFTGREELLRSLEKALDSGEPAAFTLAIAGLGGIGKTQLALEYSYRYAHKYGVIWWIRSENPETIAADCAALAKPLNLPQKDSADQELIHKAVRQWLEQNPDWLIVFDNVAEPNEIRKYLPHCETGHVLITSRYKSWSGVAKPITVFKMDEGEAVAFISKRTGKTDENAAKELAKELDYLPLALDQAGAYIEATSISISDYLDLYHKHRREILEKETPSVDYDATVASTWEISFEKLKEESPAGEELLNLCAFLAPDDIPKSMIIDGKKYLPESLADAVIDTLMFNDALAALGRYSLVRVGEDSLSLHRLVQAITRDKLSEDDKMKWSEAAVAIVNDVFPEKSEDVRTWDTCSRLLSHATVAAGFAENFKVAHDAAGRLLNQVGEYLRGRAEYE